jgi:hypothetical protein
MMAAAAPQGRPWRRSSGRQAPRRRTRSRPRAAPDVRWMMAAIPSLPRATLSRLATLMIDRIDEIDGDPDLEATDEDMEDSHDREYVHDV